MKFLETTVFTTHEGVDILSGALAISEAAISDMEICDGADFDEFLETNTPRWDYVEESLMSLRTQEPHVKFYLPDNEQGRDRLRMALDAIDALRERDKAHEFGRLEVETGEVREEDWANNWKAYFHPFTVGEKLYVKPSWIEEVSPDEAGRGIIRIDPESAFGTGNHATTMLCMETLEKCVTPGCTVADLGTGSGILTIASLLLGAERVDAIDIDQNAANVAEVNLERNGLAGRAKFMVGDVTDGETDISRFAESGYDVIAANIVADVLKAMAAHGVFSRIAKKGGALVASGIIGERSGEVRLAIEADGFQLVSERGKNDWMCLLFRKK